jgi:hypothetical protein
MFCHVLMRRESSRSVVADFRVMDPAGNLLLSIDDARCQKVDFGHSSATPLISEWWRPDAQTAALNGLAALPAPAETKQAIAGELERIVAENERATFYQDIRPALDRLAGAYAARAIADLNPGDGTFDLARLARKGGIKRERHGLLAISSALLRGASVVVCSGRQAGGEVRR